MSVFKVGDWVRLTAGEDQTGAPHDVGDTGIVDRVSPHGTITVHVGHDTWLFREDDLELVAPTPPAEDPALVWAKLYLTLHAHHTPFSGGVVAIEAMLGAVYGLKFDIVPASITFTPKG